MSTPNPSPPSETKAPRRPAFHDFPTIKLLRPASGSDKNAWRTDEWCFTLCTQSVSGRQSNQAPNCQSVCLRRVFPHEVRNVLNYHAHQSVDAEGRASYPLPKEGQPSHVPRLFGGNSDEDVAKATHAEKLWQEGWYVWASNNPVACMEKMRTMRYSLPRSQLYQQWKDSENARWTEYREYRNTYYHNSGLISEPPEEERAKWAGEVAPRGPFSDTTAGSTLLSVPPEITVFDRIGKLLEPTHRALSLLNENLSEGNYSAFGARLWEKAQTNEPFVLAGRTLSRAYEMWRQGPPPPDEEDPKKGTR